ncbi:hypothetical protein FHL15_003504 [Xylaria flabelliformis]|uniref:Major facilitator superfamily (MFS) profile domain-containing protein n=1 Tax=Xylaria flabelliformis TaxID=2512241 RepID=A0A553I5R6_9PEZI|nr:hypothetical protein FHL15_003504 [Xylaria flabelliformis]
MSEPTDPSNPMTFTPTTTAPKKVSLTKRVLSELGLISLWNSPSDIKLLCGQRFVRMLGYGVSTLILVAYLDALGNRKTEIGLFMTLTLAGDICISFFLTLFADALGRKATLAVGALLMTGSGVIFAWFGTYWILLVAAIVGVISPNGNEIGPFRAIEESIVAQLTASENRSDIYAWYSLFGLAGAAFGFMICGWVLQLFTDFLHWDLLHSYRAIYVIYASIGLIKLFLTLSLSHSVEAERKQQQNNKTSVRRDETTPLLNEEILDNEQGAPIETKHKKRFRALLPDITAMSMLVASSIARRLGNIKTMVLTHLPSQIFRALIGIPDNVHIALLFCIINASTASMDTAPRSAFLATIILPEERTAVMGTLNVVKTTASSLGPLITGLLVDHNLYWVSFVASGSLKALYDVGILIFFRHKEKERAKEENDRSQRQQEQIDGLTHEEA